MTTLKKILTALIIVLSKLSSFSQIDTTPLNYAKEYPSAATKFKETICDFLSKREQNEKNFWKYNLAGALYGKLDLSYERKLNSDFSINIHSATGIISDFTHMTFIDAQLSVLRNNYYVPALFNQSLNFEFRYYYNLKRRLRLGKTTRFSGNYFALALCNDFKKGSYDYNVPNDVLIKTDYMLNYFSLIYGIQRKLGRIGYFDGKIGYGYGFENFTTKQFYYRRLENSHVVRFRPKFKFDISLGIGIAF